MKPVFNQSGVEIYQGDALAVLRELPDESVQCCVTSPPYWGLRDYGIPSSIWPVLQSQGMVRCSNGDHLWGETVSVNATNHTDKRRWQHTRNGRDEEQPTEKRVAWLRTEVPQGEFCQLCGAWAGCFGLEPTLQLYVDHSVVMFREVRRVLRSDGTAWVNLGDSYNSGNKGNSGEMNPSYKQASNAGSLATRRGEKLGGHRNGGAKDLCKPKDLCGIPWRVAFALQSDGWYLRSDIIWHKPNPMPESVTDRPTKSHEYIFLLSKSERYYYDAEAIKEESSDGTHARLPGNNSHKGTTAYENGADEHRTKAGLVAYAQRQRKLAAAGSAIKNNGSFDEAMAVMPTSRNKRSVWAVATQPFPEAHFATFPEELIKPCILAGCKAGETVLDPFGGSGTTALVAQALHCKAILIELNPEYIEIARKRLRQETLQFTDNK